MLKTSRQLRLQFLLGWGVYCKFMLGLACFCHFAHATAFATMSFAIPMWSCENYADQAVVLRIHTSFVLGKFTE